MSYPPDPAASATCRSRGSIPSAAIALLLLATVSPAEAEEAPAAGPPRLEIAPAESADGVYQLSWNIPGVVRLEEASTPDFADPRLIYEGEDLATTLSGRPDGVYHYRAYATGGPGGAMSAPTASVTVAHHPMSRALAFFTIGAIVFASTVVVVVRGSRSESLG